MRRVLLANLFLMTIACSSIDSYNRIDESTVIFKGGRLGNKTWDDSLNFKKTSWMSGANIHYQTLVTKLDLDSPFANWLSKDEKKLIAKCSETYVVLMYANFNHNKSSSTIRHLFTSSGLEEISLNHFYDYIISHYVYDQYNLNTYKRMAYCSKAPGTDVQFALPGFSKINALN